MVEQKIYIMNMQQHICSGVMLLCQHEPKSHECLLYLVESLSRSIKAVQTRVQSCTRKVYLIKWIVSSFVEMSKAHISNSKTRKQKCKSSDSSRFTDTPLWGEVISAVTGLLLSLVAGSTHLNKQQVWTFSDTRGKGGAFSHLPEERVVRLLSNTVFFVFSMPAVQASNWILPVPPSQATAKHCHSRLAHTAAMLMVREHTGARACSRQCVCMRVSLTSAPLFVSETIMCNEWALL